MPHKTERVVLKEELNAIGVLCWEGLIGNALGYCRNYLIDDKASTIHD